MHKCLVDVVSEKPSYLITGFSVEMIDKDPHLLGDLQRFVLTGWSIHHQKVHLWLFLMTENVISVLHSQNRSTGARLFPGHTYRQLTTFPPHYLVQRAYKNWHIYSTTLYLEAGGHEDRIISGVWQLREERLGCHIILSLQINLNSPEISKNNYS